MVKNEIGREALKYNFLKKIIIRFDYDGMDDTELDQVLSDVSLKLKEHGYTNRTIETATEMQIQFDDPESGNYSEVYGKKVREQKVFVFHNENPQVKLGISSSSACINIEETKYVDCLIYCDVLWKVMKIISESGKVPFFEFKRFGLRKINQCFLRDIKCLNKYFEPAHFHVFKFQDESSIKEKVMQIRESLEIADYNVNLNRMLIRGELGGEEAYQVNYDADIYLLDESIEELIQNEEKIAEMNNWLFALYKDAVTETFLNQLIEGTFDRDMIIGVEANGEDAV